LSKLHIYLQGGGACWDRPSTWAHFCSTRIGPETHTSGIFDANNAANPFADFTVVAVLYCSGDVHIGNKTQDYDDEPESGYPAKQYGQYNTRATLDWIHANFGALDQLLFSGSSAGALGVQAWAKIILEEFPARNQQVIVDSYAGVLPCQGPIIHHWGVCSSALVAYFPAYLHRKCQEKYLEVYDITPTALVAFPKVPFAFLQSKFDATQMSFDAGVAASCLDDPILSPSDFFAWSNELFEMYTLWDNFQIFFVDANHHVYETSSLFYSATTTGTSGTGGGPKMIDFVAPLTVGKTVTSQCNGKLLTRNDFVGTDYCDANILPRSFVRG